MTTSKENNTVFPMLSSTPPSFEAAIQRLEEITDKMQNGNISLEDTLRYYEEGIELMAFCQKKLKQVEQKIEILNKKNNELEAFKFDET